MTLPKAMARLLLPSLMAFVLVGLTGCGGGGTISGKVTYQQQPVPKAVVTFTGPGGAADSYSTTADDSGNYKIAGVPAKQMKVTVSGLSVPAEYRKAIYFIPYTVKKGSQTRDIELSEIKPQQP